jgi:hypothetical protein
MNEPTIAEIGRLLAGLKEQLTGIETRMRDDRRHVEETFVRRDVYESDKRATAIRDVESTKDLEEIQSERKADAAWRRQIMLALAVLTLGFLGTLALNLSTHLAR